MTPSGSRETDREFAAWRDEVRASFVRIEGRLDALHAHVMRHGETIASQCTTGPLMEQLRILEQTVVAHRARCPYDPGGDITLRTQRRWSTPQLAGGVGLAAAAALALVELIKSIAVHFRTTR